MNAKQQQEGHEEGDAFVNMAWEANVYHTTHTYQVNAVGMNGFLGTEVLLDNQADISIMRPELLRQLRPIDETVRVNDVGGVQLELKHAGYLEDFFEVYASTEIRVNILSFAEVKEKYPITYEPFKGFTVHLPERKILFRKIGKMHIADFGVDREVHMSQAYTKEEVLRAMKVWELQRICGYPSYQELTYMLQDRNVTGMPNLTAQDVCRAYQLYGNTLEFVRGRMTNKKVTRAVVDDDLLLEEKKAILHTDVMQVDMQRFLITVCNPLQIVPGGVRAGVAGSVRASTE
jgi:hypothetical protein